MIRDGKIWIADNADGQPLYLLPKMANRHGLIAGATGTGKTITLKVMAESFSDMGVPVFIADVKGDVAGLMAPGEDSENMQERIKRFGLDEFGFQYQGYPVTLWDLYGKNGVPVRATISEMGPLLLGRVLELNDLQKDIISVAFKIADENGWWLDDTKDLKALLNYLNTHSKDYEAEYGRMAAASINAILRSIVALEAQDSDTFISNPSLNILDFITTGEGGKGMINILSSETLINSGLLYSTFLLWMLSELFEALPEVGDLDKPKMVFFFDEAHLLFKGTSKTLLDKIEQVVKLIRSKGVGVYFCTQNPKDIPDGVLAQLGNKVQHGLRAYTPAEQRGVKAAADSYRANPNFNTYETILALGTGEAVISFLDEGGIPNVCEKGFVLPPRTRMGAITESEREKNIKSSMAYTKNAKADDRNSAYEMLDKKVQEEEEALEEAKQKAADEKQAAKEEAARIKAEEAEKKKSGNAIKNAAKSVASSTAGTIGREVGKNLGKGFGSFGKTLGGNVGASIFRGIIGTLFKK